MNRQQQQCLQGVLKRYWSWMVNRAKHQSFSKPCAALLKCMSLRAFLLHEIGCWATQHVLNLNEFQPLTSTKPSLTVQVEVLQCEELWPRARCRHQGQVAAAGKSDPHALTLLTLLILDTAAGALQQHLLLLVLLVGGWHRGRVAARQQLHCGAAEDRGCVGGLAQHTAATRIGVVAGTSSPGVPAGG